MQSKKFFCTQCPSTFSNKCNLNRHTRTAHPVKQEVNSHFFTNHQSLFECAECRKKFNRKDNLIRHLQLCLADQDLILFECAHCNKKFNKKYNLAVHLRTHWRSREYCSKSIKCIECGSYFPSTNELNIHYRVHHRIQFLYENIRFESFEEFDEWKNKLEQDTICQFRIRRSRENKTQAKINYVCHRSGIYRGHGAGKRLMKVNGTKRIGGHCPAEITLSCNRIDNSCVVTFQKVHVGHEIGTKSELKHVYLSKKEKMKLLAELSSGVSASKIIKRHKLMDSNEVAARVKIINTTDVYNVRRKLKANVHTPIFENDGLNLQSFIKQNSELILYFKDKFKYDEKYGLLETVDCMVVIMDTVQEENLRRYSHKVVAIDSTCGTSPQGYVVHTLLIVNADFEGFPVAFALTNRNDHIGISVFLKCVKDRVDSIKTRILMSDMQLTYFNCWSDIMQPPEKHVYCIWRIYDHWKKNLKKIYNVEKKKKVKEQLYSLATEMDIAVFEENLQSFLSNVDDDTKHFIEYFNTYYAVCCEKWAYCYRPDAEMNTNMYLERFHNIFKKNLAKGQEIKAITSCLKYLLEYLQIKEKDYLCKEIRAEISSKLRTLHCRHKTAEKELANVNQVTIQRTGSNTWLISSFSDSSATGKMYTVKRREQDTVECADNCNLVCIQCGICFHQYKCTCQDSSVNNNMCKHIHALGITTLTDVGEQGVSLKTEELQDEIEKAKNKFSEVLQYATDVEQIQEIVKQFVEPIELFLRDY